MFEPASALEVIAKSSGEKQFTPTQDDEADGGYGWVNVICMLLLTAHTWGINGVRLPFYFYYHLCDILISFSMTGFWCIPRKLY